MEVKGALAEFIESFDYKVVRYRLPEEAKKSFELCLIDVNSGSDTKLMVKLVLDWAKSR